MNVILYVLMISIVRLYRMFPLVCRVLLCKFQCVWVQRERESVQNRKSFEVWQEVGVIILSL